MKLLVDIGNTAIKFASVNNGDFSYLFRLYNHEISLEKIKEFIKGDIEEVYISSVAPKICSNFKLILKELNITNIKEIDVSMNKSVEINIDDKNELGSDLLCDIVACKKLYGNSLAIVDFGTATKILFIDKDGVFSSCAIFIGSEQAKKSLSSATELLPLTATKEVKSISKCHNTVDVINSSVYYSELYSVKGIINQYESDVGYKVKVILTGGNASPFIKEFKDAIYDKDLVLKGLYYLIQGE